MTGLRRAGKSTLLYKIAKELVEDGAEWNQIIYINFEDERLSEFMLKDFNDILLVASEMSEKKSYFFLDEVQNVTGWESFARRIADAKEVQHDEVALQTTKLNGRIRAALGSYFCEGGFPESLLFQAKREM